MRESRLDQNIVYFHSVYFWTLKTDTFISSSINYTTRNSKLCQMHEIFLTFFVYSGVCRNFFEFRIHHHSVIKQVMPSVDYRKFFLYWFCYLAYPNSRSILIYLQKWINKLCNNQLISFVKIENWKFSLNFST